MRNLAKSGFYAFLCVFISTGLVYAALSGADFDWLSTSSGGILIKQAEGEGEDTPISDVLEFRENGAKIAFMDDNSKIDFQGKGYFSEFDSFFLRERLHIRHETALDFEAGENMTFNCGDANTMFADNFLILPKTEAPSKAGGLFITNREQPTIPLNENLASLFAFQGEAGIGAYDCIEGEGDCDPQCYAGIDAGTETGIQGQTRERDLRLTVFWGPYHENSPMMNTENEVEPSASTNAEIAEASAGNDFFASLLDLKDSLRMDTEEVSSSNETENQMKSENQAGLDSLVRPEGEPYYKINELSLYRSVEGESGPEDDDRDARLASYQSEYACLMWQGSPFYNFAGVYVSHGNVYFCMGLDEE